MKFLDRPMDLRFTPAVSPVLSGPHPEVAAVPLAGAACGRGRERVRA